MTVAAWKKYLVFAAIAVFSIVSMSQIEAQAGPTLSRTTVGKILFDDFNRASLGSTYTAEGGGTGNWSISGNRVRYQSSSAGQAVLRRNNVSVSGGAVYEVLFNVSSWASFVTPRLRGQLNGTNYYYFDSHFNQAASIRKVVGGTDTAIVDTVRAYLTNTDYRVKMQVGSTTVGGTRLWINDTFINSGTNTTALTQPGNGALSVADFGAGTTVLFDNLSVYTSTNLTVNGTYGSWALVRNDGTTLIGSCNTQATVDYGSVTSFPADYANGSGAQVKVWPTGNTTCSGASAATFTGTPGSEVFGGDVFGYTQ